MVNLEGEKQPPFRKVLVCWCAKEILGWFLVLRCILLYIPGHRVFSVLDFVIWFGCCSITGYLIVLTWVFVAEELFLVFLARWLFVAAFGCPSGRLVASNQPVFLSATGYIGGVLWFSMFCLFSSSYKGLSKQHLGKNNLWKPHVHQTQYCRGVQYA